MRERANLRVLKPTRKRLHKGDLFVMQVADKCYLSGRVIGADLPMGHPMPGSNLLYVYSLQREHEAVDPEELRCDRLLIPPVFTNRLGWTWGYFKTVGHFPLSEGDTLDQHCFWSVGREKYLDERGEVLPGPVQPCGIWGLASLWAIDDLISDALGIPRADEVPM